MSKASELVSQAATSLVLDHPFFASLLLHMRRVEDPSVSTACTDGVSIRYNPEFIESLPPGQIVGLLAHEVLHPALGHLHRLPATVEGNIAGDYAINNFLDNYNKSLSARRLDLPPGGLIDHKLDDCGAEEILSRLRQGLLDIKVVRVKVRTYKQGGWGEFEEQAACAGDGSDGKAKGRSPDEMAVEWDRRVVQAATAARMQKGNLPGCIEKLVNRIVNPRVPWERLLERFVENTADADYSWQRPDRRFLPEDIIIPEIHDTTLGEIVVAIDTSASIFRNGRALDSFEAEINAIILECRPKNVTVIYCDTRVTGVEEYGSGERIQIKAKGCGGTDFRPVGAYIKLHNISPRVCIYLTDLAGIFPDGPWDFPTIWCVYGNSRKRAPFGDTVHISKYYP